MKWSNGYCKWRWNYKKKVEYFNFEKDIDHVFNSFMQQYNINLIDECWTLPFKQFKVLLNGLGEDTSLVKIISIRKSKERTPEMRKLQQEFSLTEPEDAGLKFMNMYRK